MNEYYELTSLSTVREYLESLHNIEDPEKQRRLIQAIAMQLLNRLETNERRINNISIVAVRTNKK